MGPSARAATDAGIRYYDRNVINRKNVLTIPNLVSLCGFLLVLAGCALLFMADSRAETGAGLAFVVAGRLADLLDGKLARHSGQTSRFGAALDASLDKLAGLAIITTMWARDLAPAWALVLILAQNIANSLATLWATRLSPHKGLKPTDNGKYAMALQNLALGLYVVSFLFAGSSPGVGTGIYYLAHIATIFGTLIIGGLATWDYVRRIK